MPKTKKQGERKNMKKLITVILIALLAISLSTPAFAADKGWEKENESVKTWLDSIGYEHALVYYEILNTSDKPLYCSAGKAELETSDGKLVKSSDMISCYPQIIEPGEKGYYAESLLLDSPVEGELSLYSKPKAEPAKVKNIRLDVTEVSFEDSMLGVKARGRVRNKTGEDVDGMIYIAVMLYDFNGDFLGNISTVLTEEIEDGDRTSFEATALSLPSGTKAADIGSYITFAYPYQFQF